MKQLFRKSMVEKMANPEQLDKAVQVTSSMSWLALIGVALIIAAAVVWACFGTLPETLTVNGIIVPPENSCAIYAKSAGIIEEVTVSSGSFSAGDTIARVRSSTGAITDITAPEDGTLTTLLCSSGNETIPATEVYPGYEIARYSPSVSGKLLALCFVPVTEARKIHSGMEIQIYPAGVDNQQDGHMTGTVVSIGEYAVGVNNMAYVLGVDNQLADIFISSGPVVSVVCEIKTDSGSENGFFWTNANGKKLAVGNGTLFSAKIITGEYAPISKIFGNLNGGNS